MKLAGNPLEHRNRALVNVQSPTLLGQDLRPQVGYRQMGVGFPDVRGQNDRAIRIEHKLTSRTSSRGSGLHPFLDKSALTKKRQPIGDSRSR